jgi:hypothetical protein
MAALPCVARLRALGFHAINIEFDEDAVFEIALDSQLRLGDRAPAVPPRDCYTQGVAQYADLNAGASGFDLGANSCRLGVHFN